MKNSNRLLAATAIILMVMVLSSPAVQRQVLLENQINTSCQECYSANLVLDQLVQDYPDCFAVVAYHAYWPSPHDPYYLYNISENIARIFYYPPHYDGFHIIPYVWIDGFIRGGYYYNNWAGMVLNRYNVESPLEIQLGGEFDEDTREGNLDVTIIAHEQISQNGLRIRIALTEDSLYYQASNSTLWHNNTMRDMIPDTLGISLDISEGETVELSQSFSCPNPLVIDQCKLIIWVQADYSGKEILQTARIRVDDLGPVSIDDVAELPSGFKLDQNYPNPFNAKTTIFYSLEKESRVTIDIYDLSGNQVATIVSGTQPAGDHQLIWNGADSNGNPVSSGVYFYRMNAGRESLTRRMVLLK